MHNRLKKSLPQLVRYSLYVWLGTIVLFVTEMKIYANRLNNTYYKPFEDLRLKTIYVGVAAFCLMTVFVALERRFNYKNKKTQKSKSEGWMSSVKRVDIIFMIVLTGLLVAFMSLLNQRALDFERIIKVKNYETINNTSSPVVKGVVNKTPPIASNTRKKTDGYYSYCQKKEIAVYVDELILYTRSNGEKIYSTQADIDCYETEYNSYVNAGGNPNTYKPSYNPSTYTLHETYPPCTIYYPSSGYSKTYYSMSPEDCNYWKEQNNDTGLQDAIQSMQDVVNEPLPEVTVQPVDYTIHVNPTPTPLQVPVGYP